MGSSADSRSRVVLVTQSCLSLCNPPDCSPPGSLVHGILQVRILEWVVILFSKGEFHGQRSLLGHSPLCRKESDWTEPLTLSDSQGEAKASHTVA